jgi:hypothetical protein
MPVAKFAYLMMDPRLMEIWLIHRRHCRDKFIILVREAEHVVASKSNTPERARIFATDAKMLQLSAEQLKRNWFDSFMLLLKSHVPYRILKFPQFVDDYLALWTALRMFGGLDKIPIAPTIWRNTLDKSKITAG